MVWIYHAFFEPGTGGNKRETEHEQGLLLLQRALREQYGIDCGDGRKPDLIEGAHGKPYLREYPQIQFNISTVWDWPCLPSGIAPWESTWNMCGRTGSRF